MNKGEKTRNAVKEKRERAREVRWVWIKKLHQPGLHGGSLHSWQTGWWWWGWGWGSVYERDGEVGGKMREKEKDIQRQGKRAMKTKTKAGVCVCVCVCEEAQARREQRRTEAEERVKIGREKSVYSGKCMREGWGGCGCKQLEGKKNEQWENGDGEKQPGIQGLAFTDQCYPLLHLQRDWTLPCP